MLNEKVTQLQRCIPIYLGGMFFPQRFKESVLTKFTKNRLGCFYKVSTDFKHTIRQNLKAEIKQEFFVFFKKNFYILQLKPGNSYEDRFHFLI